MNVIRLMIVFLFCPNLPRPLFPKLLISALPTAQRCSSFRRMSLMPESSMQRQEASKAEAVAKVAKTLRQHSLSVRQGDESMFTTQLTDMLNQEL